MLTGGLYEEGMRLKIYLAGPEVFLSDADEIGKRKKKLCAAYGFEGIFPADLDPALKNMNPKDAAFVISRKNEDSIRKCDVLIANITPFRGPSADVGTAFEMGFARGLGKIVCAYTNISVPLAERTAKSTSRVGSDAKGIFRDENDMAIEQFGLVDNLMLPGSVEASGGILIVESTREDGFFRNLVGFEKCLRYIKEKTPHP